jgi:hypothetical protein
MADSRFTIIYLQWNKEAALAVFFFYFWIFRLSISGVKQDEDLFEG